MVERIKSRRTDHSFFPVSRNFCNYPLARDGRTKGRWRRSSETGKRWCPLPGQSRIKLRLAADAPQDVQRIPTGFDVAVMLTIVGAAAVRKNVLVEIKSLGGILAEMGLPQRQRYRRQLQAALVLWSHLRIEHKHWYRRGGIVGRFTLPRPFREIRRSPGLVKITVSQDWLDTVEDFYCRVPQGLPVRATHQNLVLWLLNAKPVAAPQDGVKHTQPKTRRQLCSIIGASHGTRNRVLNSAIGLAKRWFADRGGGLNPMLGILGDERAMFEVTEPSLRRRKPAGPSIKKKITPPPEEIRSVRQISSPISERIEPTSPPPRRIARIHRALTEDGDRADMYELIDTGEFVQKLPKGYTAM